MAKKRVLFVNEFSQLATGFSTYMYYVLPRLFKTGKYEIAEHASYINSYHPKIDNVPWKVYPNEPEPGDAKAVELFKRDRQNQFGKWRFEEVCIEFRPDYVISIRDPFFDDFIDKSPFRKNFKWIWMNTCDGEPQKQEWLDLAGNADVLMTYSVWAKNLIEKSTGGRTKVRAVASPGADTEVYKPLPKAEVRQSYGLESDILVFGTVMRNQPRKLFPELMKAFNLYLDKCHAEGRSDIANKSYLYLHTSWPDVGWNIPEEIKRHHLSHKVLMTYMCDNCGVVYPSFYSGENCVCRRCHKESCRLPNTAAGVDREILSRIMSCFDVYIQYSISEGWCMPINDAKACGVPVMAVEYSAMTEQAYNGGAIPLRVERMCQESLNQTNQLRAWPDNKYCAEQMFSYATSSEEAKVKLSKEARECVEHYYSWDNIAAIWEKILDEAPESDQSKTWQAPLRLKAPPSGVPEGMTNEQFIQWAYQNVLQQPELYNSVQAQNLISILNMGYEQIINEQGQPYRQPVDRNMIISNMIGWVNNYNALEEYRYKKICAPHLLVKPEVTFTEV